MAYYIYLNPWEWSRLGGLSFWRSPNDAAAAGRHDLRSIPQMSQAGGIPQGVGLFIYPTPQPGMALDLGSDITANLTRIQKSGIETLLGYAPGTLLSNTLGDILWELYTQQADPTGDAHHKPIRGVLNAVRNFRINGVGVVNRA